MTWKMSSRLLCIYVTLQLILSEKFDIHGNVSYPVMSVNSSSSHPQVPQAALQTTKALSFEKTEESISQISDSVSLDSTVTLENLPLNPSRLVTPPWSTEDTTPSCSNDLHDGGCHLREDGGYQPRPGGQSPGWSSSQSYCSETESVGLHVNWSRVPYWDSSRSEKHNHNL